MFLEWLIEKIVIVFSYIAGGYLALLFYKNFELHFLWIPTLFVLFREAVFYIICDIFKWIGRKLSGVNKYYEDDY